MKLKPCRITNCPNYGCPTCKQSHDNCEDTECLMKKMFLKPRQRMEYIHNKLSTCVGYSKTDKLLRCEELSWIIKEYCTMLDIEVEENGTWKLVKESFAQER